MRIISTHAPRVGSDRAQRRDKRRGGHFNPRSPCGERHDAHNCALAFDGFQSTLPVWGATMPGMQMVNKIRISIHAPRVGSDAHDAAHRHRRGISIHAPRVGSDPTTLLPCRSACHFNPRSPCGERRRWPCRPAVPSSISIHAPRVGSDSADSDVRNHLGIFQSTLPVWERLHILLARLALIAFQSTLPVWERPRRGAPLSMEP